MPKANLYTFNEIEKWTESAVLEIFKDLDFNKNFSLAFSGGSTPQPIYQLLASQDIPWENADVFQVDERYIAPDRPESNMKLILENFVEYLATPAGRFHFF